MSKVVKGVKKVFRRVVKVVKKVLPVVLAAAAVVFTAGAALVGTAGWAAAAAKVGSVLGTGTLGKTVAGAVYHAGYGAVIGGAAAELSGGSFTDGARRGAAIGAVTGGLAGGLGRLPQTNPAQAGTWKGLVTPAKMAKQPLAGLGGSPGVGPTTQNPVGTPPVGPSSQALSSQAVKGSTVTGATQVGSGMHNKWLQSPMLGHVVAGLGQGFTARGDQKNAMQVVDRQHQLRQGQYGNTMPRTGLLALAPSPQQLTDYGAVFRRRTQPADVYDPATGLIRRVIR